MLKGDVIICKKADIRNLISVGEKYVVRQHWGKYVDIILPTTSDISWVTLDSDNFYTISEYREKQLKKLGL